MYAFTENQRGLSVRRKERKRGQMFEYFSYDISYDNVLPLPLSGHAGHVSGKTEELSEFREC